MKVQELKDKMIKTCKSFSINKAFEFIRKNVRYFSAGALMIALVLVLANCTGIGSEKDAKDNTESITETEITDSYQEDAIPAVNELIQNYYKAYAKGSTKSLKKYAKPLTKKEKSYIKMFSEYLEGYENIKCYTKPGLDENSYLVSVYIEIKFKDVDTKAPGLDFFYVKTDEDGALYIDNLYSQFNLLNKEKELDKQVKSMIDTFENQRDVIDLQAKVQNQYEIALASDEKLAAMINETIKDACVAWKQSYEAAQAEQETETEANTEAATETETEEPPVTEEPTAPSDTPEQTSETVYALSIVNIRSKASETADLIDTVPAGTALTRTGTTDDGWSKLSYNGGEAYVKSEFVSTEAPQTEPTDNSSNNTSNVIAEGTKVMLAQSVNVRASMSETADKVGTAFAGETVTVVMSYAEGWTKVNWNDKTGYIKTEFLK